MVKIEIRLKDDMTLWFNYEKDIGILYLTFNDETLMRVFYKDVYNSILESKILKADRVTYENKIVDGVTAQVHTNLQDYNWTVHLKIPEMNFDEIIKFHLSHDTDKTATLKSEVSELKQVLRFKRSSLHTINVLTHKEKEERQEKKRKARKMYSAKDLGL